MGLGRHCSHVSRRAFLNASAASTVGVAVICGGGLGAPAHAAALTQEARDAMTPDDVVALLIEGNERFVGGNAKPRDFLAEQHASAAGQHPAAVALTCIDSRAPLEIICDLSLGDTFNARLAGNAVNDDIMGSMEFACAAAGAKLVVVMGHTACGAIKGAIEDVELGNLTGLLAKIRPAVVATKFEGERSASNPQFVDAVARTHVMMALNEIREGSKILHDMERDGKIKIVGSMYDLETAKVTLI